MVAKFDNFDSDSSKRAFEKFMAQLMGGLTGPAPDFVSKSVDDGSIRVQFGDVNRDGYTVKATFEKDGSQEDGEDLGEVGCANCTGCDCSDAADEEIDADSITSAQISFTVSGPSEFASEIAQDVYELLLDLRRDALRYAKESLGKDAEELVSVGVDFTTSTE